MMTEKQKEAFRIMNNCAVSLAHIITERLTGSAKDFKEAFVLFENFKQARTDFMSEEPEHEGIHPHKQV